MQLYPIISLSSVFKVLYCEPKHRNATVYFYHRCALLIIKLQPQLTRSTSQKSVSNILISIKRLLKKLRKCRCRIRPTRRCHNILKTYAFRPANFCGCCPTTVDWILLWNIQCQVVKEINIRSSGIDTDSVWNERVFYSPISFGIQ